MALKDDPKDDNPVPNFWDLLSELPFEKVVPLSPKELVEEWRQSDEGEEEEREAEEWKRTLRCIKRAFGFWDSIYVPTASGHKAYVWVFGPEFDRHISDALYVGVRYAAEGTGNLEKAAEYASAVRDSGLRFESTECRKHYAFVRFKSLESLRVFLWRPPARRDGSRPELELGRRSDIYHREGVIREMTALFAQRCSEWAYKHAMAVVLLGLVEAILFSAVALQLR